MKIYNEEMFNKYLGCPIRIQGMMSGYIAIAEGALLASFNSLEEIRQYFPYGNYQKL